MKANHNIGAWFGAIIMVGFNILKEQDESKSQLWKEFKPCGTVGFNILKEQDESKSQLV